MKPGFLRRTDGTYDRLCISVSGCGVGCMLGTLSLGEMSQSFLLDETPREGIHNSSVPFGVSVFRHIKEFRENPYLHLLFSKYL